MLISFWAWIFIFPNIKHSLLKSPNFRISSKIPGLTVRHFGSSETRSHCHTLCMNASSFWVSPHLLLATDKHVSLFFFPAMYSSHWGNLKCSPGFTIVFYVLVEHGLLFLLWIGPGMLCQPISCLDKGYDLLCSSWPL